MSPFSLFHSVVVCLVGFCAGFASGAHCTHTIDSRAIFTQDPVWFYNLCVNASRSRWPLLYIEWLFCHGWCDKRIQWHGRLLTGYTINVLRSFHERREKANTARTKKNIYGKLCVYWSPFAPSAAPICFVHRCHYLRACVCVCVLDASETWRINITILHKMKYLLLFVLNADSQPKRWYLI